MFKIIKLSFILIFIFNCNFLRCHPHSYIYLNTQFVTQGNQLTQLIFNWQMDELTSSYIKLDHDKNPKKTVQELMTNLFVNNYFSELLHIKNGNKKKISLLLKPVEAKLTFDDLKANLYFKLIFKNPISILDSQLELVTYEKSFYVDMHYINDKQINVNNKDCIINTINSVPDEKLVKYANSLDETEYDEDLNLGEYFAQKVKLICK